MADDTTPENTTLGGKPDAEAKTFTQADLDRIVAERVSRERGKYADYDDLKKRAGEAKTSEERIADLESRLGAADAREKHVEMAGRIAKEHGVTDSGDLGLLQGMVGLPEEFLVAFAKRCASNAENKKTYLPSEGSPTNEPNAGADRSFVRQLFGESD